MNFAPKLDALPPAQRALWPSLKEIPRNFVLYGGTALALRFGHRISVDFDFFANAPIKPESLLRTINILKEATVRDAAVNTLTVDVNSREPVKLSFFGVSLGRVLDPDLSEDGILQIASTLDVAGCKMAAIQTRAEVKDYLDIHELWKNGISIAEGLSAAQAIYGEQFNPVVSLKALSSFVDGDLRVLSETIKRDLSSAAFGVRDIPEMKRMPGGIVPASS